MSPLPAAATNSGAAVAQSTTPAANLGEVTEREASAEAAVGANGTDVAVTAVTTDVAPADPAVPAVPAPTGFQVTLTNFSGPFDLLLQLIGKQKLEITELSLSQVTDEFISYIRAMGDKWDLDEVSEFLVVAATLLDLKAAKLLPQAEVEDDDDLALLEARDLLFARLLQYKAFKEAASVIARMDAATSRSYPRVVKLEPRFSEALPELVLGIGAERLAQLAVKAFGPKPVPVVATAHVHMVRVSVREHLEILRRKLLRLRQATFRALCADCGSTLEVVARFLALLELYRESLVDFDQITALGELTVRWIGDDAADLEIVIDEYSGAAVKPDDSDTDADSDTDDNSDTEGKADADATHVDANRVDGAEPGTVTDEAGETGTARVEEIAPGIERVIPATAPAPTQTAGAAIAAETDTAKEGRG